MSRSQEVKSLPSSLNALVYLCFNVGPVLVKAVVALTASVGFFLVGLSIKRFGQGQQKQRVNGSTAGDHEGCRGRGCEDDDNDDYGGRGDDYEDDGGGAESGGLIVKCGPASGRYGDKSYLPLHRVTVPGSSSVVVDYDHSQDYARGRWRWNDTTYLFISYYKIFPYCCNIVMVVIIAFARLLYYYYCIHADVAWFERYLFIIIVIYHIILSHIHATDIRLG